MPRNIDIGLFAPPERYGYDVLLQLSDGSVVLAMITPECMETNDAA